jgi:hypothetical protein
VVKGQKVPKYINISPLKAYGNLYPPLKRYYKPQYRRLDLLRGNRRPFWYPGRASMASNLVR